MGVVSQLPPPTHRMSTFTSICLLSLLASSPAGQHSLEKRQTTVTFPTLHEALPRTLDGVSLTTVGLVVLALIVLDVVGTIVLANLVTGRSSTISGDWDLRGAAGRIYNSIDLVEAGLDFAGVEEQACRLRTICEVEQAAANNPFARLAINTINSNLSGLSKYQEAVNAGLGGQDCSLLYSQCPLSYARAFTSLL